MFKKKKKLSLKQNKSSKVTVIKKFILKFKRWQEQEDQKKKMKENDINHSIKPKGYFARKIGVISFWGMFSFMFLVVIVTLFSSSDSNAQESMQIENNKATAPEAIQFAENFLKDYFTWIPTNEGREQRKETMQKYVAHNIRSHAGLDILNMEYYSRFNYAELKKITEKGKDIAFLTFLVSYEFEKVESEKEGKPEKKNIQKYIDVPVTYDGHSYGVFELPKFSFIYEDETTVKEVKYESMESAETVITTSVQEFLPTFFKTYAEDTKDKLNFMLTKDNVTDGLNGTMNFEAIQSSQVLKGKEDGQYIVFAEIKLSDPVTNTEFFVNHQLELVNHDDRFLVSGMNNYENKGVISTVVDGSMEDEVSQTENGEESSNTPTEEEK